MSTRVTRPLTDNERRLLAHVMMWGSDSYPIRKVRSRWIWDEFFGVKGAPTTFRTKREAFAAFEAFLDVLIDSVGEEARQRALGGAP